MFIERLVKDRKDLPLSTTKDSSDPNKKEKKVPRQKVVARDIQHLKKLINKVIKEDGNKCDLNFIDVSHIEDMSYLFAGSKFCGDISKWKVSSVTNMSHMFYNKVKNKVDAELFNGDLSKWDVSNVKDMSYMFYGAVFNRDISNWNVSNVTNMSHMFHGSLFNGDISNWNVSKVKNMSYMFCGPQNISLKDRKKLSLFHGKSELLTAF